MKTKTFMDVDNRYDVSITRTFLSFVFTIEDKLFPWEEPMHMKFAGISRRSVKRQMIRYAADGCLLALLSN